MSLHAWGQVTNLFHRASNICLALCKTGYTFGGFAGWNHPRVDCVTNITIIVFYGKTKSLPVSVLIFLLRFDLYFFYIIVYISRTVQKTFLSCINYSVGNHSLFFYPNYERIAHRTKFLTPVVCSNISHSTFPRHIKICHFMHHYFASL